MSISAAEFLKWCEVFNVVTGGAGPIITFPLMPNLGGTGSSSIPSNGQIPIGDGAIYQASTITAGTGVSITNGAGSITINATGGGVTWSEVTGTSQAMSVNHGYVANNAALVTLTLPAVAAIGEKVIVQGKGTGLFRIAQNAGQLIHFNNATSSLGVIGYAEATQRYNTVELICITANNEWALIGNGNITIA